MKTPQNQTKYAPNLNPHYFNVSVLDKRIGIVD